MAIAWLVRDHQTALRVRGDWPVSVSEVSEFLPGAARLRVDGSPRGGLFVLDSGGEEIGYALRTMPQCRDVIGYSGPTDALVVLDAEGRVAGVAIRKSYDTPSHVEDVEAEIYFMQGWNGKTWEEIAAIEDYAAEGIYAVSGATRTSEALMESIRVRFRDGMKEASPSAGGPDRSGGVRAAFRFGWRDAALAAFLLVGVLFAFVKHRKWQRWRWLYSLATIAGLGLWMGDLLAQSLLMGWTESRVPWEATPGVVLLAFGAFLIPWAAKQPVYCQFICPHGNLQRWTRKILPSRWKPRPGERAKQVLRWIPPGLLAVVLCVSFWRLDFDLAGIEPFDAYLVLIGSAGTATLVVAAAGLVLSLFFPMVYCKYGCPTGWLLEFVRRRAGRDRFSWRDATGAVLLVLAVVLRAGWGGV